MLIQRNKLALTVLCTSLFGCGTFDQRATVKATVETGINDVREKADLARAEDKKSNQLVTVVNGRYLGSRAVPVSRDVNLPAIFSKNILFEFPGRPSLIVAADRLSKILGMPVRVSPDAYESVESFAARTTRQTGQGSGPISQVSASLFSENNTLPFGAAPGTPLPPSPLPGASRLNSASLPNTKFGPDKFHIDTSSPFRGSAHRVLDKVASIYGVGWDYKDGEIEISRLVTRTYQIATISDTNESSATVTKGGTVGSGSGGSSGQSSSATTDSASSDLTTKINDSLDVAKSLDNAINIILTPNVGKLSISPSGIVTVYDTREVQKQVKSMIDAENHAYSRQIRLRITFIDMRTTISHDTGFSWDYIVNSATKKYLTSIASPTGLPGASTGFGQYGISRKGGTSTADFFIKALSEHGHVGILKDESYLIMNNRSATIADVENYTYAARQVPGVSNSNSVSAQIGVEPGTVTTGTFYNVRSSIQPNGSVITRMSLDSSMRGKMQQFTSNGAPIQFPSTSGSKYHLYSATRTGVASVIAAIDNSHHENTDRSFDSKISPILGGGIGNNINRRAVLILVTPEITEGVM